MKLASISSGSHYTYLHKPLQIGQIPVLHQQRSGRLYQCPIREASVLNLMVLSLWEVAKRNKKVVPRSPVFDCWTQIC